MAKSYYYNLMYKDRSFTKGSPREVYKNYHNAVMQFVEKKNSTVKPVINYSRPKELASFFVASVGMLYLAFGLQEESSLPGVIKSVVLINIYNYPFVIIELVVLILFCVIYMFKSSSGKRGEERYALISYKDLCSFDSNRPNFIASGDVVKDISSDRINLYHRVFQFHIECIEKELSRTRKSEIGISFAVIVSILVSLDVQKSLKAFIVSLVIGALIVYLTKSFMTEEEYGVRTELILSEMILQDLEELIFSQGIYSESETTQTSDLYENIGPINNN